MTPKKSHHLRPAPFRRPLKEIALFGLDILYNAVIIIALVVLIRTFLISPFRVIGSSMADTLSNNEFILIDKLSYRLGEPKRGDPIVFLPPVTSKYPPKFEETVNTDPTGHGSLNLLELSAPKQAFYCNNRLVRALWLCQEKAREGDLVYILNLSKGNELSGLNLRVAQSRTLTSEEIKSGRLDLQGLSNQSYIVRIYNNAGPEYFVKRIIGVPGDTIRIENGRVYLRKAGEESFTETPETYLNDENKGNTYFRPSDKQDDFLVPEGHYFVLGDNRTHSNDSRHWFTPLDDQASPFVSEENISGRVLLILWPLNHLGLVPSAILQ